MKLVTLPPRPCTLVRKVTLKQIALKFRAYGDFQGHFEITNNRGASIFSRRVSARDSENGELFIPVNIPSNKVNV